MKQSWERQREPGMSYMFEESFLSCSVLTKNNISRGQMNMITHIYEVTSMEECGEVVNL